MILEEKRKEITEDHIETLKYLLKNINPEYVEDLKEILNLIIKKIVIKNHEDIDIYL